MLSLIFGIYSSDLYPIWLMSKCQYILVEILFIYAINDWLTTLFKMDAHTGMLAN